MKRCEKGWEQWRSLVFVVVACVPRRQPPPAAMGMQDNHFHGPPPSAQSLRHREREHVRKVMAAEAREKCHVTRDAYVACAKGRTLSLPFMCRGVFKEFNACLAQYTTDEELERRLAAFVPKEFTLPDDPFAGRGN